MFLPSGHWNIGRPDIFYRKFGWDPPVRPEPVAHIKIQTAHLSHSPEGRKKPAKLQAPPRASLTHASHLPSNCEVSAPRPHDGLDEGALPAALRADGRDPGQRDVPRQPRADGAAANEVGGARMPERGEERRCLGLRSCKGETQKQVVTFWVLVF